MITGRKIVSVALLVSIVVVLIAAYRAMHGAPAPALAAISAGFAGISCSLVYLSRTGRR